VFEFKYVPEVGKRTGREEGVGGGLLGKGVERRNLLVLVGFVGVCGWVGWRVLGAVVGLVGRLFGGFLS